MDGFKLCGAVRSSLANSKLSQKRKLQSDSPSTASFIQFDNKQTPATFRGADVYVKAMWRGYNPDSGGDLPQEGGREV